MEFYEHSREWFENISRRNDRVSYVFKGDLLEALYQTFPSLETVEIQAAVDDAFHLYARSVEGIPEGFVDVDAFCGEFGLASQLIQCLEPLLNERMSDDPHEVVAIAVEDAEALEDVRVTAAEYAKPELIRSLSARIFVPSKALVIAESAAAHEEANAVRDLLLGTLQWSESETTMLTGDAIDPNSIRTALEWMANGNIGGNALFVYYSGSGESPFVASLERLLRRLPVETVCTVVLAASRLQLGIPFEWSDAGWIEVSQGSAAFAADIRVIASAEKNVRFTQQLCSIVSSRPRISFSELLHADDECGAPLHLTMSASSNLSLERFVFSHI